MATMPTAGDGSLPLSPNAENQIVPATSEESETSVLQNGEVSPVNGETQAQPAAQEDTRGSYFALAKGLILRALVIYFITSFFRGPTVPHNVTSEARKPSSNIFPNGTMMDMYVYVSEEESISDFRNSKELVWRESGLLYGDWYSGPKGDGSFEKNLKIIPTERVLKQNGTMYIHVYFVKAGNSPDPKAKGSYHRKGTVYRRKVLTRLKKRIHKTQRLLIGDKPAEEEKPQGIAGELITHWHPNLTINIVNDQTQWIQGSVPPPLDEYVEFEPTNGKYYPVVYINDYWNLQRDYQPINETTDVLSLTLTFQPISLFRWQMYSAQSMRSKWTSSLLGDSATEESDEDQDSLKEAFIETNPYLLGITIVVSIFHTIFELLAFKNDIQFWKNRNSLEGLSVRSVMMGVVQSLIVLLYVMDNETNTLVRVSVFVGLAIDIWKIQKVVNININREDKFLGIIPKITFSDKGSYVESSTREYDRLAFRYLSWCLYPLILGYAVYSLLYLEHKGWYSWFLSMLYGFLLTFGFIMMTPQLFINYKLKSVAHMPWRMMTYKALNTFIDDIFAFVIKMPTLYRLGCFRDDIIFFIFLYQRWIYRVDPSRINEFGISAEMEQEINSQQRQLEPSRQSEESEPLVPGDKKND